MKIWLLTDWVLFWICHSSFQKCIAETKNEIYKAIKANTNAVCVKGFFQAKKTAQTYFKYRLSNHRTIFWGQSLCHHRCFSSFTCIWFDLVVLFITLYKVILTFESVGEILKCDHANESYWAVLSCGAVYYVVQSDSNFLVCTWNPQVWLFRRKLITLHKLILTWPTSDEILIRDHSNEHCWPLLFWGAVY